MTRRVSPWSVPVLLWACSCTERPPGHGERDDPLTRGSGPKPPASRPVARGPGQPSQPDQPPLPADPALVELLASKGLQDAQRLPVLPLASGMDLVGVDGSTPTQRQLVLNDQAALRRLCEEMFANRFPPLIPPDVAFAEHSVVAVCTGMRNSGGYSVRIQAVLEKAGKHYVVVHEEEPGPGVMTTMALTQPFHIARTAKLPDAGVEFLTYKTQSKVR